MSEFKTLIKNLCTRPEMWVIPGTYDNVCAYLCGYDKATNMETLKGFREWLIPKVGGGSNLTFDLLALKYLYPKETLNHTYPWPKNLDQKQTIKLFGNLILEFLDFRESPKGLEYIYKDYENWLLINNNKTEHDNQIFDTTLYKNKLFEIISKHYKSQTIINSHKEDIYIKGRKKFLDVRFSINENELIISFGKHLHSHFQFFLDDSNSFEQRFVNTINNSLELLDLYIKGKAWLEIKSINGKDISAELVSKKTRLIWTANPNAITTGNISVRKEFWETQSRNK